MTAQRRDERTNVVWDNDRAKGGRGPLLRREEMSGQMFSGTMPELRADAGLYCAEESHVGSGWQTWWRRQVDLVEEADRLGGGGKRT